MHDNRWHELGEGGVLHTQFENSALLCSSNMKHQLNVGIACWLSVEIQLSIIPLIYPCIYTKPASNLVHVIGRQVV